MALNFPDNPAPNEIYTSGGKSWRWDGTSWLIQVSPITGNQGVQGSAGPQGIQGAVGPQGSQGDQGNQGDQGAIGLTGSQGRQGSQGSQGVQGAQGFLGVQGNQGFQGVQGIQGAQGRQGSQGFQGIQGNQGFQGVQGNQGFQGVQGVQGAQGRQGSQGFQGVQGNQGFQGVQGALGNQGNQGNQGFQGIQGVQGALGNQGNQGNQGFQGIQGVQGAQGRQGAQGFQGVQGNQGFQGIQGNQGFQGIQGATGTGSQGFQGVQGNQGPAGSGGIADIKVAANSGPAVTANGINFVNTSNVLVTVSSGINGNANVSFATNISATEILDKLKTVDGIGSGLDADLLDGKTGNNYGRLVVTTTQGGAADANYWAKIATISTGTNQFQDASILFAVTTRANDPAGTAIVSATFRSSSTGNDPRVDVKILELHNPGWTSTLSIGEDSFKVISGGWSTDMELWFQKKALYSSFNFYVISEHYNATITYNDGATWQLAEPTGAVNNVRSTLSILPSSSTSRILYSNGYSVATSANLTFNQNTQQFLVGTSTLSANAISGNVGIGTITPTARLDVSGDTKISGNVIITNATSNDALRITQTGTGNVFVVEDAANPDGTMFVIDENGDVGIGTDTSPNIKLRISDIASNTTGNEIGIYSALSTTTASGSTSKFASWTFTSVDDWGTSTGFVGGYNNFTAIRVPMAAGDVRTYQSSGSVEIPGGGNINAYYSFIAANPSAAAGNSITSLAGFWASNLTSGNTNYGFYSNMTVGGNKWGIYTNTANNYFGGSLGIGVTTELDIYKLRVFGNTKLNDTIIRTWNSTSDPDIDALIPGTITGSIIEADEFGHSVIGIRGNDSNDGFYVIDKMNEFPGTYKQTLLSVSNTQFEYKNSNTSRFYVGSTGNIGIGTNSPQYLLDVNGRMRAANIVLGNSTGTQYGDENLLKSNNASSWLNIKGGAGLSKIAIGDSILDLVSGASAGITFRTQGGTGTGGILQMTIDTNGNVGMGVASPTARLDVSGSTKISGNVIITNSSGNDALRITQTGAGNVIVFEDDTNPDATPFVIRNTGNVGIGTINPAYTLEVNGSFAATTKSFVIDHPTKLGKRLRYASLEGPENGVYVRGRSNKLTIELPDYWHALIDEESISVNLTPIGKNQNLYVECVSSDLITIASDSENVDYFYVVFAERKDVDKLQIEV